MSHKMIFKTMTLCIKRWQLKLASFIKDARTEWVKYVAAFNEWSGHKGFNLLLNCVYFEFRLQ